MASDGDRLQGPLVVGDLEQVGAVVIALQNLVHAGGKGGNPGQWSARKAQMLAKAYKAAGGGYKS